LKLECFEDVEFDENGNAIIPPSHFHISGGWCCYQNTSNFKMEFWSQHSHPSDVPNSTSLRIQGEGSAPTGEPNG
jgi:hypothetical protein